MLRLLLQAFIWRWAVGDSCLANVVLAAFKSVCVAALQLCGRLLYTPGSLCSPGAANVAPAAAGSYLV